MLAASLSLAADCWKRLSRSKKKYAVEFRFLSSTEVHSHGPYHYQLLYIDFSSLLHMSETKLKIAHSSTNCAAYWQCSGPDSASNCQPLFTLFIVAIKQALFSQSKFTSFPTDVSKFLLTVRYESLAPMWFCHQSIHARQLYRSILEDTILNQNSERWSWLLLKNLNKNSLTSDEHSLPNTLDEGVTCRWWGC